ncbi:MAG: ornithine cyclodeaminase family protein [Pseudomonadota bacterium]
MQKAGTGGGVRYFDNSEVAERLPFKQLVDALEVGFRSGVTSPPRQVIETNPDAGSKLLLIKPSWNDRYTVVKLLTLTAGNRVVGLPYIQGVVALFDKGTGTPVAMMDANELTCRRTAAASALAARFLARGDASKLAIVGTGALAPYMAEAHAAVRPISQVAVIGRSRQGAQAAVDRIRDASPGLRSRVAEDGRAALAEADVICTVTSSKTPVIDGNMVTKGSHVDLVGAFSPDARESDDALIAKANIYVDCLTSALAEAGDLLIPIANGLISREAILGDLSMLCHGRLSGRCDDAEITVFKSVGTALEDLIAAEIVATA